MSLDGPEIERRHRSGGLPAWLEWLTSVSALVISVCSIFIAIHNGHDEDQMVQAQSFPYLEISRDKTTGPGDAGKLSLNLLSEGVGPAHEQSLTIRVGDHYATSVQDLIATVVGPKDAPEALRTIGVSNDSAPTRFLPANKSQFLFALTRSAENARWWDKVAESRTAWRVDVCYCSVFKECWIRHDEHEPVPVKACNRVEAQEYN